MSPPVLYPPARYRPVRNRSGAMIQPTRGLIAHVQVGNGSLFGWFDNPASSVSAHLWLSKTGEFEQYVPFNERAWAQAAGNAYWISCECEGHPDEDYTAAQVRALGEFYAWGSLLFGWPMRSTGSPDGYGLGTHRMGGTAWGGHDCPGTLRADRRPDILAAAVRALHQPPAPEVPVTDVVLPAAQIEAVADTVLARAWEQVTERPPDATASWYPPRQKHLGALLRRTYEMAGAIWSTVTAVLDEVRAARADVAVVRQALGQLVDQEHPAAAILAAAPAPARPAPLTLDDLLDAVPRLDALGAVRVAQAAAGHAESLLSPAPSGAAP